MYDGAIDIGQIVYSSAKDSSEFCGIKDAGRMDSSFWCTTDPKGNSESILLRFHQPIILTGFIFKFRQKAESYTLKYFPTVIDDLDWLQTMISVCTKLLLNLFSSFKYQTTQFKELSILGVDQKI